MKRLVLMLSIMSSTAFAGTKNFYDLKANSIQRKEVNFSSFKGKTVLIVNTASGCGYTPQFSDMQKLHEKYAAKGLVVVGVPSNDFNQESMDDGEIGAFCKKNYGVSFPMLQKTNVNGPKRHPVYKFLVDNSPKKGEDISWNFEKFLVGKDGKIIGRYKSSVKPTGDVLTKAIESDLNNKKS